ncbi:hypothetical protein C8Q79DRAFT_1000244 [Trametes meyenii]|nr:hypothetical protein C8Q79DRAFT_1000244 [Trametes meyenii]
MRSALSLLTFVTAASAQSVTILAPMANASLSPGNTFVVDVDKPDTLSPSYDVSVAIGLQSCASTSCTTLASSGILGNMLFAGGFSPQLRPNSSHVFQNFSVQVPSTFQRGPAVLTVAHFYLLGAGATPAIETLNTTVVIQ